MYKCEFPGCDFHSDNEELFDKHHIIPKANKGSDNNFNLIRVCKICHCKIHIKNSKKGTKHSYLRDNSLIFNKIYVGTHGYELEYTDPKTSEVKYHTLDTWRNGLLDPLFKTFQEIDNEYSERQIH